MADDHYGEQRDEAYRKMYTLEKGKRQKTLLGALAREHAPSRYFTQVRSGAYPPFRVPPSQTPSPRQVPEIWDQLMHEAMPETGTEDRRWTIPPNVAESLSCADPSPVSAKHAVPSAIRLEKLWCLSRRPHALVHPNSTSGVDSPVGSTR